MRLNATAITWAQRGLLGLIVVALAGFGLRATGKAVDTLDLMDGMVWLSSRRNGTVVQASAAAQAVTARLEVADQSDEIVTVQDGPSALVLNRSTGQVGRADGVSLDWRAGESFPASGSELRLVSGGGAAFLVDGTQGKVHDLDSADLVVRRETSVEPGSVAALVGDGGLWLLNRVRGDLSLIQSEGRVRSASGLELGDGSSLAMVGKRVFAVDPQRREVIEVDGESLRPRQRFCLGGISSTGAVISLGSESAAGVARVVTLVPQSGQVLITDLAADKCSVVEIRDGDPAGANSAGDYGQPVVSGDLLFVPISAKGEVIVVDLDQRRVRRTIKVFPEGRRSEDASAGTIELIVDGSTVWFNDPTGSSAGIIDGNGIVAVLDKYVADGKDKAAANAGDDQSLGVDSDDSAGEGIDLEPDKGVEAPERNQPGVGGGPGRSDGVAGGSGGTKGGPDRGGTGAGGGPGGQPEVIVSPGEVPNKLPPAVVALPEAPAPSPNAELAEADGAPSVFDPKAVPLPGPTGNNGPNSQNPASQPAPAPSPTSTTEPQRLTSTFQFSSANVRVGEAVQFTERATGNPTAWQWAFGDGTTSDVRNPRKAYLAPGSYPVLLTVRNGNAQAVSQPATINVVATTEDIAPAIALAPATATGEVGENLTFAGTVTAGKIVEWAWDWGDASSGVGQTASHAWKAPGDYRVNLTGRDAQGRQASAAATVTVATKTLAPEASFTFAPTKVIRGEAVSFTDTSRNDPQSVVWKFGDGTPEIKGPKVSHIYAQLGTFTVTQVVSNRKGESTAKRDLEVVEATERPVARFQVSNARPRVGEEIVLTSNSTGNPTKFTWTFSDNRERVGGRELESVIVSFPKAGEFTVQLTVENESGPSSTKPFVIVVAEVPVVRPLKADFTVRPGATAQEPAPVGTAIRFDDNSEGRVLSWRWDMGDGTSATGPSVSHAYPRPGRYEVTLTVTNSDRSDSATKIVSVAGPAVEPLKAEFAINPQQALQNEPVAFTDRSRNGPTSWQWDFGDGASSTERNPTHAYAEPGIYTVSLVVANELGQRDRAPVQRLLVRPGAKDPPVAKLDVTTPPAERIVGRAITFVDVSGGNVGTPRFTVDGAVLIPTPGERSAQFTFTQPGKYTVQLRVCWVDDAQNCGTTETVVDIAAAQQPPQAGFDIGPPNCLAPGTADSVLVGCDVVFTSTSSPETATLEWTIDGRVFTGSTVRPPSRTAAGDIAVVLRATNVAGVSTVTKIVRYVLPPPVVTIVAPTELIEAGKSVEFKGTADRDVTTWRWDFGDGTEGAGQSIQKTFAEPGTFVVTLTVTGPGGRDTATLTVQVAPSSTTSSPSTTPPTAPQQSQQGPTFFEQIGTGA